MHELSLATGVLQLAEDALRDSDAEVRRITIEVGSLSGVEPAALRFALESLAPGSVLAGADFELVGLPASAWCLQCAQVVAISSRLEACPCCGGHQLQALGGTELRVRELYVADRLKANGHATTRTMEE